MEYLGTNKPVNHAAPLVTVITCTYQHAAFIRECLDGILMQQTNFSFEMIVGEDESTDGTREICKEYADRYPDKIRLFLRSRRDVIYINGSPTGRFNLIENLKAARGKYIALCEGDDYWTDPGKLQKQVDFLESGNEFSMCFHRVYYKLDKQENLVLSQLNTSESEQTYSILNLARENIIRTPSVIFRNGLINNFPSWFDKSPVADYVLHMLNAKKGLIKYFPQPMAVYRIHEMGIWGKKNIGENYPKWINLLDYLIGEEFESLIIEILVEQKKKTLKDYLTWCLQNKKYELIANTVNSYALEARSMNLFLLIINLLEHIDNLDKHFEAVKSTRTYRVAKKLSEKKFRIQHYFNGRKRSL